MNKSKYRCSICSKKFPRKWNAQRHNNDLYKGTAYINYSSKSGITPINKRPKINRYSSTTISKFKDFDANLENNVYPPSPSSFKIFNKLYQKKSNKSILLMSENEKENLLYNKLEKMLVPFEKLEQLFNEAPYLIPDYKNIDAILSTIIIEALEKPDPVKVVQNYLAHYMRLYYRNKMISCVSRKALAQ